MNALDKLLDYKAFALLGLGGLLVLLGLYLSSVQNPPGEISQPTDNSRGWIETTGIILELKTYENSLPMKEKPFFSYKIGYAINGRPETSIEHSVPGTPPFQQGDELPVWVNPENTKNHYFPSLAKAVTSEDTTEVTTTKSYYIYYILGILCLLAGGFLYFKDRQRYQLSN